MGNLELATYIITGLVIVVLVAYLVRIIVALWKAGSHLQNLAGRLEKIADDTAPLEGKVDTINETLENLHQGLSSVSNNLISIARIFKL